MYFKILVKTQRLVLFIWNTNYDKIDIKLLLIVQLNNVSVNSRLFHFAIHTVDVIFF